MIARSTHRWSISFVLLDKTGFSMRFMGKEQNAGAASDRVRSGSDSCKKRRERRTIEHPQLIARAPAQRHWPEAGLGME
jgi:hypothetical protein